MTVFSTPVINEDFISNGNVVAIDRSSVTAHDGPGASNAIVVIAS